MISCWIPIDPDTSGNYLATPGNRYATLISVDARAPLDTIAGALKNWSLDVTYSWQSGQSTRQQYLVDRWLSSLPAPADGKVWMYFEMNFTGDTPRTIVGSIRKCVFGICGSADITNVFESRQVADDYIPCGPGDTRQPAPPPPGCPACVPPIPPVVPGCPAEPAPWKPILVGAGGGFLLGVLVAVAVD